MKSGKNNLTVQIYSTGSTLLQFWGTPQGVTFGSNYPGGFGDASFFVPWNVTHTNPITDGQRVKMYNGLRCVWEGQITGIEYQLSAAGQGINVTCTGYWGAVMMARKWRKPWADQRIDDSVWVYDTTLTGAEKCTVDRQNHIRFTPKNVAWVTNDYADVGYTLPTGETVKRMTFDYNLQEGAQQWTLALTSATDYIWTQSATGTGSQDITLATPLTKIFFLFRSDANQTPASDGTIYGQVTNVTLYTETGSINLTEIAKDVRAKATELSAYEGLIAANSYSLIPFIADPPMTYADILTTAAGYGDSSYNPWACGIWASDEGTDDKPVLFVEQQPALTDYDLALRLDETVIPDSIAFVQDLNEVRNWIAYSYTNPEGITVYVTPDDDATLKDTASITAYGQRDEWLAINTQSSTTAANYAKRYLAKYKDPAWKASGEIVVAGHIRGKGGNAIPASQVRAGMRLKIENYLNDLNGSGLTLLITATNYDDDRETVSISTGKPDTLSAILARMEKR